MGAQAETAAFAGGEGVGERADAAAERGSCCATARLHEREDVLAWLERRRANALKVGRSVPEFEGETRWMVRNIDVLLGDLRAGMHEGAAFTASAIDGQAADL